MNLTIETSGLNGLVWMTLAGELDTESAPALTRALARVPLHAVDLRLDVGGLEFIDSVGLSVLIDVANRAAQHGRTVALVSPSAPIARLLELVDVARRFEVVDTRPPAGVELGR
jgi:anti-anti-sigma factor